MKLSKVKRVCVDASEIIVKRADTGIDIRTWIGTNTALYPVRGMDIKAELAIKIWEIEPKKLRNMEIIQDTDEDEALTLIERSDLEQLSFLGDVYAAAYDEETPGLINIATINNCTLLLDKKTMDGWVIRKDKLAPIEGDRLLFIPVEENRNLIAVYGGGYLEAALYAIRWEKDDFMKDVMRKISEIYKKSE